MTPTIQEEGDRILLLPDQIRTDDRFTSLRGWSSDQEDEAKRIERLAASIEREGQLDDCILIPNGDGYVLYAGHRRRRAVALLNQQRALRAQPLLKVRCRIDRAGGDVKRRAIASNLHREGFSPMDLALIIRDLRRDNKWEGPRGTKAIAEYLQTSMATIGQHERFLDAPGEIQAELHARRISAETAFTLLKAAPEKVREVLDRAEDIQAATDARRDRPDRNKAHREAGTKPKRFPLEKPAVVEAMRETEGAIARPIVLSRTELIESIEQFDADSYGYPDGAVRQWVQYFVDKFSKGMGTPETFRKKFDAMVAKAPKGTKPQEPRSKKRIAKEKAAKKALKKAKR